MLIFRVENQNQIGPYVTGDMGYIAMRIRFSSGPLPEDEKEFQEAKISNHSMHFGCDSFSQLLNWFGVPQMRHLFSMGYKIVAVESEPLVKSKSQIGFKRANKEIKISISNMEEFSVYYKKHLLKES